MTCSKLEKQYRLNVPETALDHGLDAGGDEATQIPGLLPACWGKSCSLDKSGVSGSKGTQRSQSTLNKIQLQ